MEVKFFCLQEATKAKRIEMLKIKGSCNPAGVGTKPTDVKVAAEALKRFGAIVRRGDSC